MTGKEGRARRLLAAQEEQEVVCVMDVDVAVRQEKNEDERSSKTRRKNIEEWKEVWEGGKTLDQSKDRKKLVESEEKSGKFMKEWIVKTKTKPAETEKDVAATPASKITDIKKKLGLWKGDGEDIKKDNKNIHDI